MSTEHRNRVHEKLIARNAGLKTRLTADFPQESMRSQVVTILRGICDRALVADEAGNRHSVLCSLLDAPNLGDDENAAKTVHPTSSYGLKHVFEDSPGGFYVTNGAFKGAMIAAGFPPTDDEQNSLYRVKVKR